MFTRHRLLKEIANKALFYVEKHANEYVDWYVKKFGCEPPDVKKTETKKKGDFVYLSNDTKNTQSVNVLNNIIKVMAEKDISQAQLCEQLGLPHSLFSHWKKGINRSYTKYIYEISQILGVSISSLYGETNVEVV